MKKNNIFLSLIILIVFGFNINGLNAQQTDCGNFCTTETVGEDNSSISWVFAVSDFSNYDDIELDPFDPNVIDQYDNSNNSVYQEHICVEGSMGSLCPNMIMVVRVFVNGQLIYYKNCYTSCTGNFKDSPSFSFDFIANENDIVKVQSNIAPSPIRDGLCICKRLGNGEISMCR